MSMSNQDLCARLRQKIVTHGWDQKVTARVRVGLGFHLAIALAGMLIYWQAASWWSSIGGLFQMNWLGRCSAPGHNSFALAQPRTPALEPGKETLFIS